MFWCGGAGAAARQRRWLGEIVYRHIYIYPDVLPMKAICHNCHPNLEMITNAALLACQVFQVFAHHARWQNRLSPSS